MQIICGADVAKHWLDGWVEPAGHRPFPNTPDGAAELARWALGHDASLCVMEASGGLEQPAFAALWQAGCPCAVSNPKAVRRFAEAMGALEKTDRIDAEMIARHAAARRIVATPPPSADQQRMTALAARLRQVIGDLTAQKQRLHSTRDPLALASLKEAIAFFTGQARQLADAVAALIDADPLWAALDKSLRSVKGVATPSVTILLSKLPELGLISDKAAAKLAGLAPLADDSGKRRGARAIRGGRAGVRSLLYLVADIARKYDPSLAAFRDRLLAKGKPNMVVRTALARKLLVRLNAKARKTRATLANAH